MKNSIHYSFAILLLTVVACNDYLDIKPVGTLIPNKIEDYRAMLDNMGKMAQSYSNTAYGSDDIQISKNEELPYVVDKNRRIFKWADHIAKPGDQGDGDWDNLYGQLYIYNTVIDRIDAATGDKNEKKILKGEALTGRAYNYFFLVNLYAKQYDPKTAKTDPGVPVLTKPVLSGDLKRASIQEVYNLIFSDLNESLTLLPENSTYNSRPNKKTAYALLARASLFMGNYQKANSYADSCLIDNTFLYDFVDLPIDEIWDRIIIPQGTENKEMIYFKTLQWLWLFPTPEVLNLYKRGDMRRKVFFIYYYNFLLFVAGSAGAFPFGAPTTAEMFLIRAETYARMGKVAEAMRDINHLRKYRFEKDVNSALTASTAAEALQLVLEERRRELVFAGHRWFDLKRLIKTGDFNKTITHVLEGKTYTLKPNSNRWVLPIPQRVIEQNPEITQNPR